LPNSVDDLKRIVIDLRKENAATRVKLNDFEKATEAERKKTEEAQRKAAEEQGNFKALYEGEQKKSADLTAENAKLKRDAAIKDVVREFELPDSAVKFIAGETPEEMKESAKELKALAGQTPAGGPGISDGARGRGGALGNGGGKPNAEEIRKVKAQSGQYSI
jgi:hypothetical protein